MCDTCRQDAARSGLRTEEKTSWAVGATGQTEAMVHCSGVTPEQVKSSGGLDPARSSEYVIPSESAHAAWRWNRFVFAFRYKADNFPPKAAKNLGFAAGGYVYLITIPQNTQFMSRSGLIDDSKEVGFPNRIPLVWITGAFKYTGTQKGKEQLEPLPWKALPASQAPGT